MTRAFKKRQDAVLSPTKEKKELMTKSIESKPTEPLEPTASFFKNNRGSKSRHGSNYALAEMITGGFNVKGLMQ